jgi:RimJ/RimL family protein N-acetyltransferase
MSDIDTKLKVVFLDMPKTRVYLRPPERSDLDFFRQSLNKEAIARNLQHHHPLLEKDELDWFEGLSRRKETDKLCSIVLKETDEVIGSIGLHNIDWISRTASTGTFIGREDLQGIGLGTEAKMLWLKYAFLGLNLRQIYSRVYIFNGRSASYAKRCGYTETGRYNDHIFRDGSYHDLIHFVVTKENWMPLWEKFKQEMRGEE